MPDHDAPQPQSTTKSAQGPEVVNTPAKVETVEESKKDTAPKLEELLAATPLDGAKILTAIEALGATERQAVLADAGKMAKLATLQQETLQKIYVLLKAPLKLRLESALSATGVDELALDALLKGATAAELATLATDEAVVDKIIATLSGAARNVVLDRIVDHATTAEILKKLFEARFGIKIGIQGDPDTQRFFDAVRGGTEVDFGPNGLKRIYHVMRRLPESHVKQLLALTTNSKTSTTPSGVAVGTMQRVNVGYDESNVDAVESGAYTQDGDAMRDMNMLDTTVAHELSHVVDTGKVHSGKSDFRAISGWEELPQSNPAGIVGAIKANAATALPTTLKADESKVADKAAELAVTHRIGTLNDLDAVMPVAYADLGLEEGGDQPPKQSGISKFFSKIFGSKKDKEPPAESKYRSAAELSTELQSSVLFKHIVRARAEGGPWFREPYTELAPKQVHEAYAGRGWWAYNNDARNSKLSIYQFRDPGEEFAELYATYHMTTPKGQKVDAKRKLWFETAGLDK
ncbi:MAG: hypothetical protein RBU37_11130 [Myxococcota bacterium]|jgi:hypothetical protein|nr:hypothetical protein [Myxococcota bacterium]